MEGGRVGKSRGKLHSGCCEADSKEKLNLNGMLKGGKGFPVNMVATRVAEKGVEIEKHGQIPGSVAGASSRIGSH